MCTYLENTYIPMRRQDYRPVIGPLREAALDIISRVIGRQPGHPRPHMSQLIERAVDDFIEAWKAREPSLNEEIESAQAALRAAKEAMPVRRGRAGRTRGPGQTGD
jgi:hypothetical protein